MKNFLLYSLFAVFLTSNISKWYVSLSGNIRIYYNHLALLLWLSLAIPYLQRTRFRIPLGVRMLMLIKAVFIGTVLLAIPSLLSEIAAAELTTYIKGVVVIGFEGFSIILILLFATQLQPRERNTVVNLYLASIAVCLTYTFLQAWAIYAWNIDLDLIVSSALPFWNGTSPGIDREVFGLASGTYYRLNGLTGDPNLNGITFLVALPVVFARTFEEGSPTMAALLLLIVSAIVLTVSNTAVLLMPPVLLLLSLRYGQRSRLLALTAGCIFAGVCLFFLIKYGAEVEETLHFKLDQEGTTSSHMNLAADALSIWRAHPFGVGVNSYPRYSADYSAHNSYLQTLVELGPLGLLVSVGWVLCCLALCWRSRSGAGFATMVAVGALALSAMAHDLLHRFEFQLVLNLLVAFAVLNRRDKALNAASGPPRPFSRSARLHGGYCRMACPSIDSPALD